jgi:hypothetical protein
MYKYGKISHCKDHYTAMRNTAVKSPLSKTLVRRGVSTLSTPP